MMIELTLIENEEFADYENLVKASCWTKGYVNRSKDEIAVFTQHLGGRHHYKLSLSRKFFGELGTCLDEYMEVSKDGTGHLSRGSIQESCFVYEADVKTPADDSFVSDGSPVINMMPVNNIGKYRFVKGNSALPLDYYSYVDDRKTIVSFVHPEKTVWPTITWPTAVLDPHYVYAPKENKAPVKSCALYVKKGIIPTKCYSCTTPCKDCELAPIVATMQKSN